MRIPLFLLLCSIGCGGNDECTVDTSYDPPLAASDFVAEVTNPLFPLPQGAAWTYEGGGEVVEVTVTSEVRSVLGIPVTVVHDVGKIDGEIIEDTLDYYAQDIHGNVWYMGEDTAELENGQVVSTEGSWEAGVNDAKPGIVIPGAPVIGVPYRQEYLPCEAEDMGEVLAVDQEVTVGSTTHAGCLQTLDTTPLEPDVQEHKFYCPGVGLVLTVDLATDVREELVARTLP